MSPTDRVHTLLGKAEVFHLTLLNGFLHRAGNIFDWSIWVYAMLVEEIDGLDLEAYERCFGDPLDLLRPAFQAPLLACVGIEIEPELGGDHDLAAERRQGLAHELFIGERDIDFGGVEERDTRSTAERMSLIADCLSVAGP